MNKIIKVMIGKWINKIRKSRKMNLLNIFLGVFVFIVSSFTFLDLDSGRSIAVTILFYLVVFLAFEMGTILIHILGVMISAFGNTSMKKKHVLNPRIVFLVLIILLLALLIVNINLIWELELGALSHSIFSYMRSLITVVMFLLVSYALGKKVSKYFGEMSTRGANDLIALGLGFIIFSFLSFVMTVLHIAYSSVAYGIFGLLIILVRREIYEIISRFWYKKISIEIRLRDYSKIITLILVGSVLILLVIFSMADIVFGGWDTFHQYLLFPQQYAADGGLSYFKFHPHWGFPQAGEMLFLFNILLSDIRAVFIFNTAIYLLILAAAYNLLRNYSKKYAYWGILLVISVPFLVIMAKGFLKVELLLAFYALMTLIVMFNYFKETHIRSRGSRSIMLLAVFGGMMLNIKYNSYFYLGALVLTVFLFRKKLKIAWKQVGKFGLVTFLMIAPWLIKNLVYYGSPLYPAMGGQDLIREICGFNCQPHFLSILKEDVPLLLHLSESSHWIISNIKSLFLSLTNYYGVNSMNGIGILVLVFLVIGFFAGSKKNKLPFFIKFQTIFFIINLLLWLIFFGGQIWYLTPVLFSGMIVIFYYAKKYLRRDSVLSVKIFTAFALFIVVYGMISGLAEGFTGKRDYMQRQATFEQILEQPEKHQEEDGDDDHHGMYDWIHVQKYLAKNARAEVVYSFGEPRGYFISDSHKYFVPDFFGYMFKCIFENSDNIEEVTNNLKKIEVKYLIYASGYQEECELAAEDRDQKFNICRSDRYLREYLDSVKPKLVYEKGNYEVYKLN